MISYVRLDYVYTVGIMFCVIWLLMLGISLLCKVRLRVHSVQRVSNKDLPTFYYYVVPKISGSMKMSNFCTSLFNWDKVNTRVYIKMLTAKYYSGSLKVLETVTSSFKTVLRPTHWIWSNSGVKIISAGFGRKICGLPHIQTSTQWNLLSGPS